MERTEVVAVWRWRWIVRWNAGEITRPEAIDKMGAVSSTQFREKGDLQIEATVVESLQSLSAKIVERVEGVHKVHVMTSEWGWDKRGFKKERGMSGGKKLACCGKPRTMKMTAGAGGMGEQVLAAAGMNVKGG